MFTTFTLQLQQQYKQTFPIGVNEFNSVSLGVIIGGRGQNKHGRLEQIVLMSQILFRCDGHINQLYNLVKKNR